MQGIITLKAVDTKKEFTVRLKHRISIITGNSGLGKSKLIDFSINTWSNMFAYDEQRNRVNVYKINNIDILKHPEEYNDGRILLIDEYIFACAAGVPGLLEHFFKECLHSYIVIVARDLGTASIKVVSDGYTYRDTDRSIVGTKQYPIATDAIYTFKREKSNKKSETTNVGYITYTNNDISINGICITEDTKLGRDVVKKILRNKQALVLDSYIGGKDTIVREASKQQEDTVIVVDGAVFALELLHLTNISEKFRHRIFAYMPISLEYKILGTRFMRKVMQQIDMIDIIKNEIAYDNSVYSDFIADIGLETTKKNISKNLEYVYDNYELFANEAYSLERFFEMVMEIVLMEMHGKGYNKTNIPCLANQCANCIEIKHCRYANKLGSINDRTKDLENAFGRLGGLFLDK